MSRKIPPGIAKKKFQKNYSKITTKVQTKTHKIRAFRIIRANDRITRLGMHLNAHSLCALQAFRNRQRGILRAALIAPKVCIELAIKLHRAFEHFVGHADLHFTIGRFQRRTSLRTIRIGWLEFSRLYASDLFSARTTEAGHVAIVRRAFMGWGWTVLIRKTLLGSIGNHLGSWVGRAEVVGFFRKRGIW